MTLDSTCDAEPLRDRPQLYQPVFEGDERYDPPLQRPAAANDFVARGVERLRDSRNHVVPLGPAGMNLTAWDLFAPLRASRTRTRV